MESFNVNVSSMTHKEFQKFVEKSGKDVFEIAKLIGYSQKSITMYYYGHKPITKRMEIALKNLVK